MIDALLVFAIAVPLLVALALAVVPVANEARVAHIALGAAAASAAASVVALGLWLVGWAHPVATAPHILFSRGAYAFRFDLLLDGAAAVFLLLVQFITGTVMRFSRFYLHREPGFQRFFATVLLFQAAMCLLALAGNLDLMFAGWEMVGISSFLLIAFYRERRTAVRSALATYSVYRIADAGMLLAACLETSAGHGEIGLLLLLAAMGKSAQFPFSFWVPRAMEGPTPSSALFYGALSVHAGAYLLLRTFGIWGDVSWVRVSVGLVGVATAVTASMFSRVQPTVKAHIGYASVTQVGVVFLEIALGFTHLALLHIATNALLRCYQLLVSPSVVAHRLRQQATAGAARARTASSVYLKLIPASWQPTLYVFAIGEGQSMGALEAALWRPLRSLGRASSRRRIGVLALGACAACLVAALGPLVPEARARAVGLGLLAIAAVFSTCAIAAWQRPLRAFAWIGGSGLLASLAVFAAAGMRPGFAAGGYALAIALCCAFAVAGHAFTGGAVPSRFAGGWERHPHAGSLALLGALGVAGFPLLPTFFGEDLLVHAALGESHGFAMALAAVLALNGYLAVRSVAFAFFGPVQPGAIRVGARETELPRIIPSASPTAS